MQGKSFQVSIVFLLSLLCATHVFAQTRVCQIKALAALEPIPKLRYKCSEDARASILTDANRRRAVGLYAKTLEKLTADGWWQTDVEDLMVCDFRKKPGALSKEEAEEFENEYFINLFGDRQFRAIAVRDSCYETGFNDFSVFLLNRVGRRVFAAEVIAGFVSRADSALAFNSGLSGSEPIIEIATTSGGLNPTETNYYFTIDPKTRRAVPKNIFRDEDGKRTNRITSMMLMGDSEDYGLPPKTESLQVLKNGRLARTFDVFLSTGERIGNGDYEKFDRRTLRWNGKFYE